MDVSEVGWIRVSKWSKTMKHRPYNSDVYEQDDIEHNADSNKNKDHDVLHITNRVRVSEMTWLTPPLTYWYQSNEARRLYNDDWHQRQSPLVTVHTVEYLWHIHEYLKLVSQLEDGCDYSVFKYGIFPDWDHRENREGGRLIVKIGKERNIDQCWESILVFLVEENDMLVNGVVVSKRKKENKLVVWLHDVSQVEGVKRVAWKMMDKLRITGKKHLYISINKNKPSTLKEFFV